MRAQGLAVFLGMTMSISAAIAQAPPAPLVLEAKIPLGDVRGRIDHLAVDVRRQRLFVAELGNNSLGVVDIANLKLLLRVTGLSEPQGVGYEPATDTVYVANASDGSLRMFRGDDLSPLGRIELGDDADNVRIDPARNRVIVGYGSGALGMIDAAHRTKAGEIRLKGHPESFQIDGDRVFVNVPDARTIEIADLAKSEVVGVLPTRLNSANFPMAIDREAHRFMVVVRNPARLVVMPTIDGGTTASLDTCSDADDVFVDAKRHRVYVICGSGVVDVFADPAGGYRQADKVSTVPGARTGLFVPELNRLFVAVRAAGTEPAAVWAFKPTP